MNIWKKSTATVLALTSVFVILSLYPSVLPYRRLLFAFFFLYVVMVPGMLITSIILPRWRGVATIVSAFVFGCAMSLVIMLLISLFRMDVTIIRFVIPAIVVFLTIFVPAPRNDTTNNKVKDEDDAFSIPNPLHLTLLTILIVIVSILILGRGDPVLLTGDSPDHIAYISAVSKSHEAFPEDFYYKDGGLLTLDIRKGMMHSLWGSVNALTGHSGAYPVWPIISLFGSAFFILSLYVSGILLFKSARAGLIAAFLFPLAFRGGLADYQLAYMATGFSFGRIFYVAALMVLPRLVKSGDRRLLLFFLAASFVATGTHIAHFITLMFISGMVCVLYLLARKRNWKLFANGPSIFLIPAFLLASNLPYLLLRFFRDYAPNNPIHQHIQGVMFLTDNLYILNPLVFLQEAGPLGLLSIAVIAVLWKAANENDSLKILFTGQIAYYLLVFIPFIFPFFHTRLSYLLIRMEFVAPSMIMAAYLINRLLPMRAATRSLHPALKTIGWAAVIVAAAIVSISSIRGFAYSKERFENTRQASSHILSDVYDFINTKMPDSGVILSDPVTSFSLPAFTDQFVVCPYDQHAIPNDSTAVERLIDCRSVYSPFSTTASIGEIMKKYKADYILLNGRLPASLTTLYWRADRTVNEALAARLEDEGSAFIRIFENDGVEIFRFDSDDTLLLPTEDGARHFAGREIDDGEMEHSLKSGIPDIVITRFELTTDPVARGGSVRARIGWAASAPVQFGSYISFLRFDTDFEKNSLYREWYGKIYRKLLEKKKGIRYRFRIDRLPLNGIFPADMWPVGREIMDEVTINIPTDISPGEYIISLKMAKRTQYPNYYVKDILGDDDFYSGVPVGKIVIE